MADDNSIMSFLQGVNAGGRNCNDGWGNGNFGLAMILFLILFGGCGSWGNRGAMGYGLANATEFDSLLQGQTQIKNQMSYDNINSGIRGLERGICDSTYAVNNTLTGGFANVQQSLCQGFSGVNAAISNLGFNLADKMSTIAAQNNLQLQGIQNTLQSCCCDIKTAINNSTQILSSKMDHAENQALRDKLFEMSQREQTTNIVSQLKTTTTAAA